MFLIAGISFASVNVSNAQEAKVKGACCSKDKVSTNAVKTDDAAAKVSAVALTTEGTVKSGDCTTKEVKMAEGKSCSSACTHKTDAVTEEKTTVKSGVVAETAVKEK